ncbi:hypothetical protein [Sorangium sp. So ce1000]|uniref:hypothetical protein n=1 Tax=Sorangium sp. So ce1000 TaxID=3133325 RepID=UPI003F6215BB
MPYRHIPSPPSLLVLVSALVAGCRGAPSGVPVAPPPTGGAKGAVTNNPRGQEGVDVEGPTGAGGAPGTSGQQGCGTASPMLKYVGQSRDECSRIRFVCEPGWSYFSDDCGCGCTKQ